MAVRLVVAFLFLIAAIVVLGGDVAEDGVCTKDEPGCETVETDSSAGKSVGYREHLGVTVKAHFAMACFWGVEATFGCQPGVVRVRAGFMGGEKEGPTYKDLGDHTETVEVEYDPYKTKFSSLLEVFWKYHDYTAA
ncbi:putative peptide methionine sulfoxide reductase-like [Apostichopus japonicus]|uniref:peptide-methionine (S)-S-oxide reductase n=1 Tax=Stichopus japonicus TaxID=307972 RepID=A0A2G8L5F0_STIJA|nr:putative peptide methionine sulfoxide reductase-like [Apostichopus japonicus]